MTSFVAFSFYLCIIFWTHVDGITTKSLPIPLSNHSDGSQYVQIRSVLNQPTRAFLTQHKSALSPAQQTHILDDVQKNQRIHYSVSSPANLDDRQKSLFAGGSPTVAQNLHDQSHHKYSNYLNLNSLSPPPLQTVVLTPQQTPPTSAPHVEHVPFFRPITHSDAKSSFVNVNTLSQFEPLKIQPESVHDTGQKSQYYEPSSTIHSIVQSPKTFVTDLGKFTPQDPHYTHFGKSDSSNAYLLNDYFEKYPEPSTPSAKSKPYRTKEQSSIFTQFLDKPKSATPEKIIKEIVIKTNPEELIAKDRQKFFQQLLEDKNPEETLESNDDQTVAQNDLSNIRSQFERELLRQLKAGVVNGPMADLGLLINSSNAISEFSLPNGQKIQISKDYNRLLENDDGSNKIKAIVVKQPHHTTPSPPPSSILEELTKGVVPPGAEFEVIKRNKDGGLEEVGKLPQNIPQKKVTFVILEEQSDGTVKVQGVRGSEKESLQESGEEVETIIKKIREGELKLPPSTRLSPKQSQKGVDKFKNNRPEEEDLKSKKKSTSDSGQRSVKRKEPDVKHFVPTPAGQAVFVESTSTESYFSPASNSEFPYSYFSSPNPYSVDDTNKYLANSIISSTPAYSLITTNFKNRNQPDASIWSLANSATQSTLFDSSTSQTAVDNLGLFHLNNSGYIANLFTALKNPAVHFPILDTDSKNILQFPLLPSTSGNTVVDPKPRNVSTTKYPVSVPTDASSSVSTVSHSDRGTTANVLKSKRDRNMVRKTTKKPIVKEIRKDNDEEESNVEETKSEESTSISNNTLSDVLKKEGFFAMAKFLRQSGLDTILNDTGPFTLFIPTDKAFRTLLIQLGGPDKAEEKFKENPRLLSGLLLHHVIPGAFRVNSLQDEMTGVSLAGTQLRVNTYTTHDIEWNDITVITVNGAKILDEKDIVIPQGIAHSIDRVMFPLPVGTLLQSLQADRENRYSNFLKVIEESELSYLLTSGKTFTLFAPLNRAFTHSEFTKIISDPNESKSFVLRHLVPGALYSAGMKYYQVRDSLEDGQQVTLYKEAGKIKVNSAHVITRNIPATNGVIHAIDAFL